MAIIGFSFTKIKAEKIEFARKGPVSIKNDVSIADVQEVGIAFGKDKQPTLKFIFSYKSMYTPKIGEIDLYGEVLYLQEPKKLKTITEYWKKNRKLPIDIAPVVMNAIVSKCNLQVLILARDVNLPSPIPLPRIKTGEKKNEGAKA